MVFGRNVPRPAASGIRAVFSYRQAERNINRTSSAPTLFATGVPDKLFDKVRSVRSANGPTLRADSFTKM
jgi:hypothetical protein